MNTPKDASDTAIVRLFDELETDTSSLFDAEPSDDIAAERAAVESSREADMENSVSKQLGDIKDYLAISNTKLSPDELNYIAQCLRCAYIDGLVRS